MICVSFFVAASVVCGIVALSSIVSNVAVGRGFIVLAACVLDFVFDFALAIGNLVLVTVGFLGFELDVV